MKWEWWYSKDYIAGQLTKGIDKRYKIQVAGPHPWHPRVRLSLGHELAHLVTRCRFTVYTLSRRNGKSVWTVEEIELFGRPIHPPAPLIGTLLDIGTEVLAYMLAPLFMWLPIPYIDVLAKRKKNGRGVRR